MNRTREEIIKLINDYIYSNGQQLITGDILNEVLIVIANAFALEGEASINLDQVLENGSWVVEGREISNPFGGKLQLATEDFIIGLADHIMGMEIKGEKHTGLMQVSQGVSLIGTLHSPEQEKDKNRSFFERTVNSKFMPAPTKLTEKQRAQAQASEFSVGSVYISKEMDKSPLRIGAHTLYVEENRQTMASVGSVGVTNSVLEAAGDRTAGAIETLTSSGYALNIQQTEQTSTHTHDVQRDSLAFIDLKAKTTFQVETNINSQEWSTQLGSIARVVPEGFQLDSEKKLELSAQGNAPTAGLVQLANGRAVVATAAIQANSVVNLTVQAGGEYLGRVRVSEIAVGKSFSINTGSDTDDCSVFWQIITLL